ncbi:MAG: hypothetical protein JST83_00630 [Bacteroidetes bacterium]|nr:hypothetical protein [Bacteroidota bacterium]
MKYILPLIALLLCTDADSMSYHRRRAKEGFMGAPARKSRHSKKELGTAIAGTAIGTIGNAAIEDLKRKRAKNYSPDYPKY